MYHGCEVVFDSSEVPEEALAAAADVPDVQVMVNVYNEMNAIHVMFRAMACTHCVVQCCAYNAVSKSCSQHKAMLQDHQTI